MSTYKTILVGIAFSPTLKQNLFEVLRLANAFGSSLVLVHVGTKNTQKEHALDVLLEEFPETLPKVNRRWVPGNTIQSLLQACKEEQASLLVLGALKREGLLRFYVGSIARKLTRQAPCDVLLLINPSIERVACQHIVVNGLEHSKTKEAIKTSFYVLQKLKAKKITVVEEIPEENVAIKVEDDQSLRKATIVKERIKLREASRVRNILNNIPDPLKKDAQLRIQPIFGKRGYSIGHYAKVVRADLLVMNAPQMGSVWDRIFPHDLEYILSDLPTDLLIVRNE